MAVNLVSRAQKLLMSPNTEWDVIDKEPADIAGILTTYVVPLVLIGVIAKTLAMVLFLAFSVTWLIWIVVDGVLGVATVYVMAFIIDALAPTFGAAKNFGQAFKVSAYSPTPFWIAAAAFILPWNLWVVTLLILLAGAGYSLYLLFIGLPKLMKPVADKAVVYVLAAMGVAIVLSLVFGFVVGQLRGSMGGIGVTGLSAECEDLARRGARGEITVNDQALAIRCSEQARDLYR